jgi:hypothetical protein
VKNAAKVLTGWKIDAGFNSIFDSTRHDTTNKTFSAFYNNTVITGKSAGNGALETEITAQRTIPLIHIQYMEIT